VGAVSYPVLNNVVTTNTVTANSPTVLLNIYSSITGTDLDAIISATGFTRVNDQTTSLADFLDFGKVINPGLLPTLTALGITSFPAFTTYLHSRVGQGSFSTWKELSTFLLSSVAVPQLNYTTTTASNLVLSTSTVTTLLNLYGTGSGPFGNPVMLDYFGALTGTPYTAQIRSIDTYYSNIALYPTSNVTLAMLALDTAVLNTYNTFAGQWQANVNSSAVTSAIGNVVSAINGIPSSSNLSICSAAYSTIVSKLSAEVSNLSKAGIIFGSAPSAMTNGLALRISNLGAIDSLGLGMPAIVANIITPDANGDTIRAAIAEYNNTSKLGSAGISMNNDPNPQQVLTQSQQQNIPLSTYLSQNK
jgi:hypothetical protein